MRPFVAERVPLPRVTESLRERIAHASPLDLEIGAGQGLHALRYARENPERTLIAIERTHTRFAAFEQRILNHEATPNLIPLHADAVSVVTHLLPAESLERVFLLYPNPYPKAKQANQRWHNMPFMAKLLTALNPGGTLTLATNIQEYAREARETYLGHWNLELMQEGHPDVGRTHFERKYLSRGETCWNLVFRKKSPGTLSL